MASLREIAQSSGFSVATVSLALRDSPRLTPETKRLVHQAADRLGYRPNPMVQALMTSFRQSKSTRRGVKATIGLVTARDPVQHSRYHPGLARIYAAAKSQAELSGYTLSTVVVNDTDDRHPLESVILARGIQGLIVVHLSGVLTGGSLDWSKFAVCCVGSPIPGLPFHRVTTDNHRLADLAAANFLDRGYRRIGLIVGGEAPRPATYVWECAWRGRMALHPDRFLEPHVRQDYITKDTFLAWVHLNRPDAVLVSDVRAARWARDSGLRVPDDLALALADVAPEISPWSGIDQDHEAQGRTAVNFIAGECQNNRSGFPDHPIDLTIPPFWRDGRTTHVSKAKS